MNEIALLDHAEDDFWLNLPDEFLIEIPEYKIMTLCRSDLTKLQYSWAATKAKLNEHGYTVYEWIDDATQTHKAKCLKQKT